MKAKILKAKWYIVLFVAAFALMMLYQFVWTSADRLPGNDSYTHIAKAAILKEQGLEKASYASILPFTYWSTIRADNTLVYDYYLLVLTEVLTSIASLKVYIALVFAFTTTLFAKIINYRQSNVLLGAGIALVASVFNIAFLLKFTELRSLVISIITFFITLGILFIYKKRFWILIPVAFVMTLVHTTVFLLFVPIAILLVCDFKAWKKYLSAVGFIFMGIIAAIIVFPSSNFYQILVIQPIIPFIYRTIPFAIDGAFEVKGDLTNPSYLLVSNIINIVALFGGLLLYGLALTRKIKFSFERFKLASFLLFVLFFILDLFSRRFSDYLTPAMIIFAILHKDEMLGLLAKVKPIFVKYKYYAIVFGLIALVGFSYVFYDKYLKDNFTNTDYRGDKKSNMPESWEASMYINKYLSDETYIYNDAWEDFPYLLYYSQNHKYAAGMELGFLYMYEPDMLRFYQDFRSNNGFVDSTNDLIYTREKVSFKQYISDNFKSKTILVKKGKTEKMSKFLLENYQRFGLDKAFDDDYYTIYRF
jgi:hypothetical protein